MAAENGQVVWTVAGQVEVAGKGSSYTEVRFLRASDGGTSIGLTKMYRKDGKSYPNLRDGRPQKVTYSLESAQGLLHPDIIAAAGKAFANPAPTAPAGLSLSTMSDGDLAKLAKDLQAVVKARKKRS